MYFLTLNNTNTKETFGSIGPKRQSVIQIQTSNVDIIEIIGVRKILYHIKKIVKKILISFGENTLVYKC